jgi:hypothetical protein
MKKKQNKMTSNDQTSKNFLASYFTNENDYLTTSTTTTTTTTDLAGRSFFDLISECKNFNEKDGENLMSSNEANDFYYDIWPLSNHQLSNNSISLDFTNRQFYFAINEPLNDPLKQLVLKYLGVNESQKRILPNADSVIADANGLQILIVFFILNFYIEQILILNLGHTKILN